jgi:hypothetical protein
MHLFSLRATNRSDSARISVLQEPPGDTASARPPLPAEPWQELGRLRSCAERVGLYLFYEQLPERMMEGCLNPVHTHHIQRSLNNVASPRSRASNTDDTILSITALTVR